MVKEKTVEKKYRIVESFSFKTKNNTSIRVGPGEPVPAEISPEEFKVLLSKNKIVEVSPDGENIYQAVEIDDSRIQRLSDAECGNFVAGLITRGDATLRLFKNSYYDLETLVHFEEQYNRVIANTSELNKPTIYMGLFLNELKSKTLEMEARSKRLGYSVETIPNAMDREKNLSNIVRKFDHKDTNQE